MNNCNCFTKYQGCFVKHKLYFTKNYIFKICLCLRKIIYLFWCYYSNKNQIPVATLGIMLVVGFLSVIGSCLFLRSDFELISSSWFG